MKCLEASKTSQMHHVILTLHTLYLKKNKKGGGGEADLKREKLPIEVITFLSPFSSLSHILTSHAIFLHFF